MNVLNFLEFYFSSKKCHCNFIHSVFIHEKFSRIASFQKKLSDNKKSAANSLARSFLKFNLPIPLIKF